MTYKSFEIRPGLTAIAAVIALSSTPALGQDLSVPDPAADPAPATATPDPLAPDPVTTEPESPAPQAPAVAKAAEGKTAVKTASKVRRTASTSRSSSASSQATNTAPLTAGASAAAATEPPPAATVPTQAEATPVAAPAGPPPAEAAPAAQAIDMEETLPIAGAAGLGLLALAGAGMAVRRRKRRRETEEFEERQVALAEAETEAPTIATQEPVFARPAAPAHDPVPARAPATALPKGFDLSKFGRHVQAAYRGPTPDNPSLSLKNRLRRASFFDQQERRAAAEARASAKPAEQPAWATRKPNTGEFLFRPAARQPAPKPEFQK